VEEPVEVAAPAEPVMEDRTDAAESIPGTDEQAQQESPAGSRERAAASRKALLDQLRSDLQTGKATVKAAGSAAKKDLQLIRTAVDSQLDLLKEQVSTALGRENSLLSIGRQQAGKIIASGEDLGRRGLKKARNTADRIRRKITR
jgi:hypothetical protein